MKQGWCFNYSQKGPQKYCDPVHKLFVDDASFSSLNLFFFFFQTNLSSIWDHFCHSLDREENVCVSKGYAISPPHWDSTDLQCAVCVGVSEWKWIKGRGVFIEGQPRGKISLRAATKFSVSQISAHPWMLYSETWNRRRSLFLKLSMYNIMKGECLWLLIM